MSPGKTLKSAKAILQSSQQQVTRMSGPAGDEVRLPTPVTPVDISRSSDECSTSTTDDEPDLEQLMQTASQRALQLPKDLQWAISILLEIRGDQRKSSQQVSDKMESDMTKAVKILGEIGLNQRKVIHDQNRIIRMLETSHMSRVETTCSEAPPPLVPSQEPKLLPKEHFLSVRTSQVKKVRVDDWIRFEDLSLVIRPEPDTVYVLRSDRVPKDINDGYFWREIEAKKTSRTANPSWSGFCDPKANCQRMIKR